MIRFFILLMAGFFLSSGMHQFCFAQDRPIEKYSFDLKNSALKEALDEIAERTAYTFSYRENLVKNRSVKAISFERANIQEIMQKVLEGTKVKYSLKGSIIILSQKNDVPHKSTVYGIVREKSSGEAIPSAAIFVKGTQIGCTSNAYGFYSLALPNHECSVVCSFIGYQLAEFKVEPGHNVNQDIDLEQKSTEISEVKVVAHSQSGNLLEAVPGKQKLMISDLKSMPALAGEADVLKSLQFLPGVQSANDGSTNLHVRGGNFDQNLILLDEAPVYNPSHALGFFSVFNADAIKSTDFYKSFYPAKFGGRLSSVVDIKMKEGNNQNLSGSASVGLTAAKLLLEGPIVKDKASFLISGRYSYVGDLVNGFTKLGEFIRFDENLLNGMDNHNKIRFYDYNLKFNYILNSKNRLYWSMYSGGDHFFSATLNADNQMDWGNTTSTLRWNHIYNSKLFSNLSLIYSKYDYEYVLLENSLNFTWSSSINQLGVKMDYDYVMNPSNRLKFGVDANYHIYEPGKIEPRNSFSNSRTIELQRKNTADVSFYLEDEIKLSEKLSMTPGLRFTLFANLGAGTVYDYAPGSEKVLSAKEYKSGEVINTYSGIEPRLAVKYNLTENSSVKFSYNQTRQYVHLISNSSAGLPTDVWMPSGKNVKPQFSHQYSFGVYKQLLDRKVEVSAEIYYKDMNDIVDYKDNADLFVNEHIETQILRGKAKAKGLELYLKKKKGKFQGWISYTLADVKQKVPGVNGNQWYNAKYNVRHNLGIVALYKFDDRFTLSSNFKFKSGGYVTIPQGFYVYQGNSFPYYTDRNGYQLEDFHRLDFSLSYKSRKNRTRKLKKEWVFSLFNAYHRANNFSFYAKVYGSEVKAYKMYLYKMVPSVTYKIKF